MARGTVPQGVRLPQRLGLDLRLVSVPLALGASGHQGAGSGPRARGEGGARQDFAGPLHPPPWSANSAHTAARTCRSPLPHPTQHASAGPRRAWGTEIRPVATSGAGAGSWWVQSTAGAGLECKGAAAGRGRGGPGGGARNGSRAAWRARTRTPGAPTYTPGFCAPPPGTPRLSLLELGRAGRGRRPRRPEEQNVLPGQEEHPPDHGEPRTRPHFTPRPLPTAWGEPSRLRAFRSALRV